MPPGQQQGSGCGGRPARALSASVSGWMGPDREEYQLPGMWGNGLPPLGALQRKLVGIGRCQPLFLSFSSALLHGSLAMLILSLGVGPWWPCAWAQLGRQGRKGKPLCFCNTPRAQQGNPWWVLKGKWQWGLVLSLRNPIFSLKMGNPGWA